MGWICHLKKIIQIYLGTTKQGNPYSTEWQVHSRQGLAREFVNSVSPKKMGFDILHLLHVKVLEKQGFLSRTLFSYSIYSLKSMQKVAL